MTRSTTHDHALRRGHRDRNRRTGGAGRRLGLASPLVIALLLALVAPTATPAPTNSTGTDVRAYGAIGDGTADDTAAIQAAFNSGASDVFFSAGTYSVGTITIPTATRRVFGSSATVKQRTLDFNLFYLTGPRLGTVVESLTFQGIHGTALESWNNGVYMVDTSNVTVKNSTFTGLRYHAVYAKKSQNIHVTDNTVYGICLGIRFSGIQGGSIQRNTVRDPSTPNSTFTVALGLDSSADDGLPNTTDITIADNTVRNYVDAQGLMVHDGSNLTITNNLFDNVLIGIELNPFIGYDAINTVTVTGNTYYGTTVPGPRGTITNYGIAVSGGPIVVRNVLISGNTVVGGNSITQSDAQGGIAVGWGDSVKVTGNTVRNSYGSAITFNNPNTNISVVSNTIDTVLTTPGGSQVGVYLALYGGQTTGCVGANTIDTVSYGIGAEQSSPDLVIAPNQITNNSIDRILNPSYMTIDSNPCPT